MRRSGLPFCCLTFWEFLLYTLSGNSDDRFPLCKSGGGRKVGTLSSRNLEKLLLDKNVSANGGRAQA